MKDLNPILKESIDHFCKAPSLQQLHHVCCQFRQEYVKDDVETPSDSEAPAPPEDDDDREEIQIVIDGIKDHISTSGTFPVVLQQLEQNMNSVVLIVRKSDLTEGDGVEVPKDKYIIRSQRLKDRKIHLQDHIHTIHPTSRYANQHSADSLGTGFFIMPGVIVTAAHVLNPSFYDLVLTPGENTDSDKEVRFITDVKISAANKMENGIIVDKENVFETPRD